MVVAALFSSDAILPAAPFHHHHREAERRDPRSLGSWPLHGKRPCYAALFHRPIGAAADLFEGIAARCGVRIPFSCASAYRVICLLTSEPVFDGKVPDSLTFLLLTGKRGTMAEEVKQAFRDSGLSHLLAIAGLHLGLVGGFVFLAVRGGLALIPWIALRFPIKKIAAGSGVVAGVVPGHHSGSEDSISGLLSACRHSITRYDSCSDYPRRHVAETAQTFNDRARASRQISPDKTREIDPFRTAIPCLVPVMPTAAPIPSPRS